MMVQTAWWVQPFLHVNLRRAGDFFGPDFQLFHFQRHENDKVREKAMNSSHVKFLETQNTIISGKNFYVENIDSKCSWYLVLNDFISNERWIQKIEYAVIQSQSDQGVIFVGNIYERDSKNTKSKKKIY